MEPGAPQCLTSHTCWYLHLDICPSTVMPITSSAATSVNNYLLQVWLATSSSIGLQLHYSLCFSSDSICHREMYNWSLGTIRRQCHDFFSISFQFVTGMRSCSRCQPSWTTFHLVRLPTLKTTTTATTTDNNKWINYNFHVVCNSWLPPPLSPIPPRFAVHK